MPDFASIVNPPRRRLSLAADSKRHLVLPILILAVVVIVDQITKIWAAANLSNGEIIQVLGKSGVIQIITKIIIINIISHYANISIFSFINNNIINYTNIWSSI